MPIKAAKTCASALSCYAQTLTDSGRPLTDSDVSHVSSSATFLTKNAGTEFALSYSRGCACERVDWALGSMIAYGRNATSFPASCEAETSRLLRFRATSITGNGMRGHINVIIEQRRTELAKCTFWLFTGKGIVPSCRVIEADPERSRLAPPEPSPS